MKNLNIYYALMANSNSNNPEIKTLNYDGIYSSLKERSQYNLNGLTTLNQVKKIHNCTTDDILKAAKLNATKKIGDCTSHTSIFDFGITRENLLKSSEKDKIQL